MNTVPWYITVSVALLAGIIVVWVCDSACQAIKWWKR